MIISIDMILLVSNSADSYEKSTPVPPKLSTTLSEKPISTKQTVTANAMITAIILFICLFSAIFFPLDIEQAK